MREKSTPWTAKSMIYCYQEKLFFYMSAMATIVIVSGYFNPIHKGHIRMIKHAKKLGDKLVVIVNNDKQQHLKKGKIIMPEDERHEVVTALRDVDEVILSIDEDR